MITIIHRCENINDSYHNVLNFLGNIFNKEGKREKYTQLRYVLRISFILICIHIKYFIHLVYTIITICLVLSKSIINKSC